MTMSSIDHLHQKYAAFFDVDPLTGRSIEVFYADRTLETFGMCGAGWFWGLRQRGFAQDGPARGPFSSSYSAFKDALQKRTPILNSSDKTAAAGSFLISDAASGMRQGAAEQIASDAARASARAELNSVQNLSGYQVPGSTIGGEGVRQKMRETPIL